MSILDLPAAPGSTQILLRGNLRVIGSFSFGPDLPATQYHARFEKLDEGIVCRIDAVDELEAVAISKLGVVKVQRATSISDDTAFKSTTLERVAIQINKLVGEDLVCVIHNSSPVVVRTSTVADAGEAASFPGRGR